MTKHSYILDTEMLCKISNDLNSWKWPVELGEEPNGWGNLLDYDKTHTKITKSEIIRPFIVFIESIVGKKEILRHHWIYGLKRTNEQFENWWSNRKIEAIYES